MSAYNVFQYCLLTLFFCTMIANRNNLCFTLQRKCDLTLGLPESYNPEGEILKCSTMNRTSKRLIDQLVRSLNRWYIACGVEWSLFQILNEVRVMGQIIQNTSFIVDHSFIPLAANTQHNISVSLHWMARSWCSQGPQSCLTYSA